MKSPARFIHDQVIGFMGAGKEWEPADVVRENAARAGTSARAKVLGLRAYALLWLVFLLGGLWTLAMAIGLADWIMVDVLGL